MPRARLRTRSGGWLVLHASRLKAQSAPGEIAVILEPAQPGEVAPLAFLAYELTQREAEVGGLVMRGFSTGEIAAALFISPYTVQQHLKSVFEKTGVRSRRDFVARILAEQYLPRVRNNAAIGADGWFA